jgi:hypothetical protein
MFVMCEVCGGKSCSYSPASCSGHLDAPLPQLYTDILDWYRSSRPQWDTPQPNVVTGTDVSIAAPVQTAPQQFVGPTIAAQPVISAPIASTGQVVTTTDASTASTAAAFNEVSTAPQVASPTPIAQNYIPPISAMTSDADVPQLQTSGFIDQTPAVGTTLTPTGAGSSILDSLSQPAFLGLNWWEVLGIAGVAYLLTRKNSSSSAGAAPTT